MTTVTISSVKLRVETQDITAKPTGGSIVVRMVQGKNFVTEVGIPGPAGPAGPAGSGTGTGLPDATVIGQFLISVDGSTFTPQVPAVSDLGEIAVDDEGVIGVVG